MATAYKILGQSAPTNANTDTDVYTVGVGLQQVISSIVITNRGTSNTTFRIALRPNGATIANSHYIAFDTSIAANSIVALTLGITIDEGDIVTVSAGNTNLTFSIFGSEIS